MKFLTLRTRSSFKVTVIFSRDEIPSLQPQLRRRGNLVPSNLLALMDPKNEIASNAHICIDKHVISEQVLYIISS